MSKTRSTASITSRCPRPRIDRPLVRARDFAAYAGHEVKVELTDLLNGRKRFRGFIVSVDDEAVTLKLPDVPKGDDPNHRLPLALLAEAKLVMTDALMTRARADQERHPIDDDDDRDRRSSDTNEPTLSRGRPNKWPSVRTDWNCSRSPMPLPVKSRSIA